MANNNITAKEHFIPQTYLRGFSPDQNNIYGYRMNDGYQPPNAIPIASICYERYLYELFDSNKGIVNPNYLEKQLCSIENIFNVYKKQVESKAFIEENYKSNLFLTKQEREFLKFYIALQILRTPKIIAIAKRIAKENFPVELEENELRAIAIVSCLPFFQEFIKDGQNVIDDYFRGFSNMSIAIGVDKTDSIFTSDFPFYGYSPDQTFSNVEEIIFPLTSSLVIFMFGGRFKEEDRRNYLFPIHSDRLEHIKHSIAMAADEWIYSKKPLSDYEKDIISKAHKERLDYLKNQGSEVL